MQNKNLLAILLLSALSVVCVVESLCPDLEDTAPCKCKRIHGKTTLTCKNVTNVRVLEKVAKNSDGYRYDEVYIVESKLPHLPWIVLEEIRMTSLILKDLALTQFYDDVPYTPDELKNIYLQNIRLKKDFSWKFLKYTKSLEFLYVEHVHIPVITTEFNEFVSPELKEVFFLYTDTKEIQIDAFRDFRYLDSVAVINNRLRKLQRSSFPKLFNGTKLNFQSNYLTEIKESFFTGMPNLKAVYFNGNQISRIYEPNDLAKLSHIEIIDFTGNPIKCDCYLEWVTNWKPKSLRGTCASPKQLRKKRLQNLTEEDFDC
ncbi:Slit protein like [Argiope bruennichi]|uniref:Slit protein like n=1 Tax=Argiope bruennichi TaxID=94029 RepID=A0A8T0FER7_ARGBR|nr:Slit protein like [Argiope bruennichi]